MKQGPSLPDIEFKDAPSFDRLQADRYRTGGKGGDGDPAYARDMSMMYGFRGRVLTTIVMTDGGTAEYRREGD